MKSTKALITACLISLITGTEYTAQATVLPQLPRTQVDVTMPTVTGSTLNATCATLQAQLNAAAAMSVNLTHQIILATGTLCTGPYILPSHNGGTGWILIKGANYSNLPPSGTRVQVSDATLMPQIQYGEDAAVAHVGSFSAATGAQRYRIIGIDMVENPAKVPNWAHVTLGYASSGATNTGYIILDRVIIRNRDTTLESMRGVYGDTQLGNTALLDSVIMGIKARGGDTQAWLSVTNPGPILIQNNFLQSTGENFMLCGATPLNDALQPRDVTVKSNLMSKESSWWGASGWLVKTLLELKCGVRVLVEGNTFQDMPWNDGGMAHRLTPRNDSYTTAAGTFLEVSDITIRYNLYKNVTNWINSIASDDSSVCAGCMTKHSKRWFIHDNLIYGLGWSCGGGASCGALFSIMDGGGGNTGTNTNCTDPSPTCKMEDLSITHNTIDDVRDRLFCVTTNGQINLDFKDNLINNNGARGLFDCGGNVSTNYGSARLSEAWTGASATWTNNIIANIGSGESSSNYPQASNSYPANYTSILWTNRTTRDYTLQPGSPAKSAASDGTDLGVNFNTYNTVRAGGVGSGSGGADVTPPATPQNVTITK